MKLSIKTKLIAGLLSVIAVIMVAIFALAAFNFSDQSLEAFRRSATGELTQVDYAITLFLDESKMNADMLAKHPLGARFDEITTSHTQTTQPRKARVDPDDATGKQVIELFTAMQASHPAYVEVFVGTKTGAFVSALQDSDMPDQVRSIATASEQQSAASEEISRSVEEVSTISAETSQAMNEAARAVSELAEQAQVLQALIDELQRESGSAPVTCAPPARLGSGRRYKGL